MDRNANTMSAVARTCAGRTRLAAAAGIALVFAGICCTADGASTVQPMPDPVGAASPLGSVQADVVAAPERRFVAPTDRDRIGRIWAPVLINNKGPFRLVLDTGATHSAVTADVALALGLPLLDSDQILLRGVTGSATVPTIPINGMVAGDLDLPARRLPIIANALGGAQGILGTEGLLDKKITIDFRNDSITIIRSHGERAGAEFITIPFKLVDGLAVVDAWIGSIPAQAIIDTGGQGTIGNVALHESLLRRYRKEMAVPDGIVGITLDVQLGNRIDTPTITLGRLTLGNVRVTTGDMDIFRQWHMTRQPVVLIGMDVLGLFDTLIIDYGRRELQVCAARGS
jgi:hypothetical protein